MFSWAASRTPLVVCPDRFPKLRAYSRRAGRRVPAWLILERAVASVGNEGSLPLTPGRISDQRLDTLLSDAMLL